MLRKPVLQVPSEAQAREKLAVYVYEYLYHLGAHKTAQVFLNEIGWEKNIEVGEMPGFLSSWWGVFWDLYCAAPERRDKCDYTNEAKAFHDYNCGSGNNYPRAPPPSNNFQALHGGVLMPNGEVIDPATFLSFGGSLSHVHGLPPGCVHPSMQFGVAPSGMSYSHGGRAGPPTQLYPGGCSRLISSHASGYAQQVAAQNATSAPPVGVSAYSNSQTPYCSVTSPQHGQLGGPPSVQSVQSNPSAFSSAGQPQTVASGHPGRPSPWRTPNGASSYCTSPYAASSLPESIGAPQSAIGSNQLGHMIPQADGLGGMLLGESDSLLGNNLSQMFSGAPSPRTDDAMQTGGAQYANGVYGDLAVASCGFSSAPTSANENGRRLDAGENTAILKIKESMREEAKRFETSDSSSVVTQNSN